MDTSKFVTRGAKREAQFVKAFKKMLMVRSKFLSRKKLTTLDRRLLNLQNVWGLSLGAAEAIKQKLIK